MKPRIHVAWHGYDIRVSKPVQKHKVSWDDSGRTKLSVGLAILSMLAIAFIYQINAIASGPGFVLEGSSSSGFWVEHVGNDLML